MNGKLAPGNFFWKWISLAEGENDEIIEMSVPNSSHKIAIEKKTKQNKTKEKEINKTIKGRNVSFMSFK